jgi:hypothetical protein
MPHASTDDASLVRVRKGPHDGRAVAAALIAAAVLAVAWLLGSGGYVRFKSAFTYTDTEANLREIYRALITPAPQIGIIGSSLARRLEPGLFFDIRVANLAVGGGSVMTGASIMEAMEHPPPVILVEINILDRPLNAEWAEAGSAAARSTWFGLFHGITKPIRHVLAFPLFIPRTETQDREYWRARTASLLSGPPRHYDIDAIITAGRAVWDERNDWPLARRNAEALRRFAELMERRGSKVHFVYLPYSPGLDDHSYAVRSRVIAGGNEQFECGRCIDVRRIVDMTQIRWGDGAHLDERSAAIVAAALKARVLPGR